MFFADFSLLADMGSGGRRTRCVRITGSASEFRGARLQVPSASVGGSTIALNPACPERIELPSGMLHTSLVSSTGVYMLQTWLTGALNRNNLEMHRSCRASPTY